MCLQQLRNDQHDVEAQQRREYKLLVYITTSASERSVCFSTLAEELVE